jgi:hypothetical protein
MARVKLTFRQRDVTAAIRAIEKAGHKPSSVRIGQDGSIVVDLAPPVASETAPDPKLNPWDEVPDYAGPPKARQ